MDKLTMAQDYIIAEVRRVGVCSVDEDKIMDAWKIADAMQAEADKHNKAEAEKKRKEIREMLNAPNTFVEREGQHFDDVEEAKREGEYFFKLFCRQNGIDDSEVLLDMERPNGF